MADDEREDSPPLQLDPSTLAALTSFLDERADAERQFAELEKKAHERLVAAQEGQADAGAHRIPPLAMSTWLTSSTCF